MCSRPSQRWATVCESSCNDRSSVAMGLSRAVQATFRLKMLESGYRLPFPVRVALSLPSGIVRFTLPLSQNTSFLEQLMASNGVALQVYCVFLFCCTASLFGTIISQINEIVAAQASMMKELDGVLEAYLTVKPRSLTYQFCFCRVLANNRFH